MQSFDTTEKIAVVGLGYVGLPAAIRLSKVYEQVTGIDSNSRRIADLRNSLDRMGDIGRQELENARLRLSNRIEDVSDATAILVAVPTPLTPDKTPDLEPLRTASRGIGRHLQRGTVVIYESTVYPGVTEEICKPELEAASGLQAGSDFQLAYSPERVNPGDQVHTFENITKVVGADSPETLERVVALYSSVVHAGVHAVSSIRVAEAAKVIENIQRDLNIALMNELALIFERLDLPTMEILKAAETKWNFLPFRPGLVGGHCIGVDPYYLTSRAEQSGYNPEVILAGRRINDYMGTHIARTCVKLMVQAGKHINGARVAVLGAAFKEDVPDIRNSQVVTLVRELQSYRVEVLIHDPLAFDDDVARDFGLRLSNDASIQDVDAVILAVAHTYYQKNIGWLEELCRSSGLLIDVKNALPQLKDNVHYWSL